MGGCEIRLKRTTVQNPDPFLIRFPLYIPTLVSTMLSRWCEMDFVHPQYGSAERADVACPYHHAHHNTIGLHVANLVSPTSFGASASVMFRSRMTDIREVLSQNTWVQQRIDPQNNGFSFWFTLKPTKTGVPKTKERRHPPGGTKEHSGEHQSKAFGRSPKKKGLSGCSGRFLGHAAPKCPSPAQPPPPPPTPAGPPSPPTFPPKPSRPRPLTPHPNPAPQPPGRRLPLRRGRPRRASALHGPRGVPKAQQAPGAGRRCERARARRGRFGPGPSWRS